MINKVTLIGNLGKDPELRRLENGTAVAKFSMATNESYKDKNGEWQTQTEWHDIVVWRALAERAEQQLKKGKLVYIEGKLTHRKWTDKNDIVRYTTEVVANTFRLLERRENSGSYSSNFPTAENAPSTPTEKATSPVETESASDSPAGDDDLPF